MHGNAVVVLDASCVPSEVDLTTLGAVANRKLLVEHGFADRAEERIAARNLRKGAPRGARDGADGATQGALHRVGGRLDLGVFNGPRTRNLDRGRVVAPEDAGRGEGEECREGE